MANVFVISDTHFGHANICKFLREDGTKLRPWDDVNEMDEVLIQNWNKVVGNTDKVYHLGDVYINRKSRHILHRLNGDKILIKGNHDIFSLENYTPYFRDIRAYHVLDKMIFSHIPVHVDNLPRFRGNVHGHLHQHRIKNKWGNIDERYVSVCVEHIDYTPIELSILIKFFDQYDS